MNCSQTEILIHALLDNELATSHAIDVEAHLRTCAACSEELAAFEITRKVVVQADLMEFAPVPLRKRLQLGWGICDWPFAQSTYLRLDCLLSFVSSERDDSGAMLLRSFSDAFW